VNNKNEYLKSQVGNPEGADKPNKKYYDPRVWVREAEKTLSVRVKEACEDLGNVGEWRPSRVRLYDLTESGSFRPFVNEFFNRCENVYM